MDRDGMTVYWMNVVAMSVRLFLSVRKSERNKMPNQKRMKAKISSALMTVTVVKIGAQT